MEPENGRSCLVGTGIGCVIALCAVILAMLSGVSGAGTYLIARPYNVARVLFPYSMFMPWFGNNRLTGQLVLFAFVLAVVQFPLYGAAVGLSRRSVLATAIVGGVLLIAHSITVALCFSGMISDLP
jgi:hypothetical protein